MKRKIIQITYDNRILIALCDDGTIWKGYLGESTVWYQLSDVPQPTKEEQPQLDLTLSIDLYKLNTIKDN
ncbi:MAG: hypothetical protein EO766_12355 [Hydrotalea sp. AMD]|uniref:hypothetical protein n=1 Tax=Hydrotalea sp. AMD TaxID=2501297 RepID=UPI0010264817|nr:hypothetical protein [Hydrotalea sp. AMD]RWZ87310.1 MAG: hypothetical protein EO766_12355 [Hydrotalea sp. AMD]